ncbi:hypothetical protein ACWN8V_11000 [Vagococcus elongatus]|uniref:4-hydroxythreonine-4-phosphate dehydrogenase n=1 Tax=Vagococcus elongatus TaxID=180344 RepID=A0A430ANS7_9ENTE|nr:hypothetical protein [Vagococcus elongatus]RSU09706.1 hypothetical protein CBF29_11055 [Vagococcus elongatus]
MLKSNPSLIVMLTLNDCTVANAYDVFEKYKDSKAQFWGFKEIGLSVEKMKKLYSYMKACGKTTILEVVQYTEEECLKGAELAVECGCHILIGTIFFDSVSELCRKNKIQYMPFVGDVKHRPSVLEGSVEEMIKEANEYIRKGAAGVNLLAYRFTGDSENLIREIVAQVDGPVCIAGSINSFQKLDTIKDVVPWAFTIGEAFFNNQFESGFGNQINHVCDYMKKNCKETSLEFGG